MASIFVLGLGIMGLPMARNLVSAGHSVTGYDHNSGPMEALVEAGGKRAANVAEAVPSADVVITMLPDSPDVEEAVLGQGGVLSCAREGMVHIDMSTIRPDVAVRVSDACRAKGVRSLDAPVSGGERGAIEATLSVMVGGDPADFEAVRPILAAVGRTIVHVGPHGAGQTVKAANQLIVGGTIQLVSESIAFLEAYHVDTTAAVEVLAGGLAGNRILDTKAEGMLAREFAPGFRIDLHHKDMGIVTSAAREAGVVIPVGSLVAQLMASARANGDGHLDHSALLRGVERLSGRAAG